MRWTEPRHGITRARCGFLLLPRRIGNELRWLERADWIEQYTDDGWKATEWMNP